MSKIKCEHQVIISRSLAEQLGIQPDDEIEWTLAGGELRIRPVRARPALSREERLALFDLATRRQAARNKRARSGKPGSRGWTREELYDRRRTR